VGTVEGVLKEELERLGEVEKGYREAIRKLPKGSLQQKHIKGYVYPYLVYRKESEVVSEYKGHFSPAELKKLEQDIELRRRYEKLLKEARENKKKIMRMLYGKKRAV